MAESCEVGTLEMLYREVKERSGEHGIEPGSASVVLGRIERHLGFCAGFGQARGLMRIHLDSKREIETEADLGEVAAIASLLASCQPKSVLLALVEEHQGTGFIFDDDGCQSQSLLLNGGAEEPEVNGEIPGWTEVVGSKWHPLFDAATVPIEGLRYFTAGVVTHGELRQDVDVSLFAPWIDRGVQRFFFEGHVRSADENLPDTSEIIVEHRAEDGEVLPPGARPRSPPSAAGAGWRTCGWRRREPASCGCGS